MQCVRVDSFSDPSVVFRHAESCAAVCKADDKGRVSGVDLCAESSPSSSYKTEELFLQCRGGLGTARARFKEIARIPLWGSTPIPNEPAGCDTYGATYDLLHHGVLLASSWNMRPCRPFYVLDS